MGVSGRSKRAAVVEAESKRVEVEGSCRQGERPVEVLGDKVRVMA